MPESQPHHFHSSVNLPAYQYRIFFIVILILTLILIALSVFIYRGKFLVANTITLPFDLNDPAIKEVYIGFLLTGTVMQIMEDPINSSSKWVIKPQDSPTKQYVVDVPWHSTVLPRDLSPNATPSATMDVKSIKVGSLVQIFVNHGITNSYQIARQITLLDQP